MDPIATGFVVIFAWIAGCVCLPWVLMETFLCLIFDHRFNWWSLYSLLVSVIVAVVSYSITCYLMMKDTTKKGDA